MIMDHYRERWTLPPYQPLVPWIAFPPQPPLTPLSDPRISDAELADFRKLLERAKKYDADNHEPDCELDEKKQALLKIAEQLGVKIDFL